MLNNIFSSTRKSRSQQQPPGPPANRPQSSHIGGYGSCKPLPAGCHQFGAGDHHVMLRGRPQHCPAHGTYGLSPRRPPPPPPLHPAGVAPMADFYGSVTYPTPDHPAGDRRCSVGSQKFATVANRLSFAFEVGSLPQLVTNVPSDAGVPLEYPIPTPPPTPPVRPQRPSPPMAHQDQQPSLPAQNQRSATMESLTSVVQFMRRANSTASTDSQFKVTLRKSRSRSRRARALPRFRFLPALSQSPNPGRGYEVIDSHPTVLYRPRYFAQRRSLVEGLEKLHLFGEVDPEDGLDYLDENSGQSGGHRRRHRRDSCPGKLLTGDSSDDIGRSISYHGHQRRIGEVRQEAGLRRRCRTFSRPRDGPLPKSPLPVPRRDRSQRAFYFFHIRTSNLAQSESFLFDGIVLALARRHSCTLRLLAPDEAQDLPDGLRRVEVAGPSLKDIKGFLYHLTTSEETVSLQRQIQERFTLCRGLSATRGDGNGFVSETPSTSRSLQRGVSPPRFSGGDATPPAASGDVSMATAVRQRLWRTNSVSAASPAASRTRMSGLRGVNGFV